MVKQASRSNRLNNGEDYFLVIFDKKAERPELEILNYIRIVIVLLC